MKPNLPPWNPRAIIVIGDVHGYTKTYQKFLSKIDWTQETIQCGDMGLGFSGVGLHPMHENNKFIRGNHDDPAKCRKHKNYLGEYGYDARRELFYISGAWSIDRDMRIEGQTWWAEEELSYTELQKCIDLYEQTKPRLVVSHECPSKAGETLLYSMSGDYFAAKGDCQTSRTAQAMQSMLDIHQPKEWVFSHYHINKSFQVPGYETKFTCVGGMMESNSQPQWYPLVYGRW